jgi:hypothetical protein
MGNEDVSVHNNCSSSSTGLNHLTNKLLIFTPLKTTNWMPQAKAIENLILNFNFFCFRNPRRILRKKNTKKTIDHSNRKRRFETCNILIKYIVKMFYLYFCRFGSKRMNQVHAPRKKKKFWGIILRKWRKKYIF